MVPDVQPLFGFSLFTTDEKMDLNAPCDSAQLNSLVLLKIMDSSKGCLLGIDSEGVLVITNSFASDSEESKKLMLNCLEKLNYETHVVGNYIVSNEYLDLDFITELYESQMQYKQAVSLVVKTIGSKTICECLRLTDEFIKFYEAKQFGHQALQTMAYDQIFQVLPVTVKNSGLMDALSLKLNAENTIGQTDESSIYELIK